MNEEHRSGITTNASEDGDYDFEGTRPLDPVEADFWEAQEEYEREQYAQWLREETEAASDPK
jgi:hypothetical protein